MSRFHKYLTKSQEGELEEVAHALVAPGKGLLAADEPPDSMGRRFDKIGVDNSEETRRRYRQILLSCGDAMSDYISGVILQPETLTQTTDAGLTFPQLLSQHAILPGVNVDKRTTRIAGTNNECSTQGLDGLAERCQQYVKNGARFAKWQCVYRIDINSHTPSQLALTENANVLARFASICQQNGLVPIIEPEISMDGDHDLATSQRASEMVWSELYKALHSHHVFLEGTVLKTSMVIPGKRCMQTCSPQQIAAATVSALRRTVPVAVPGVGFLSGGQSEEDATVHLDAINKLAGDGPWALTFIFGRALQASALSAWGGLPENTAASQNAFLLRAKANSKAALGIYS